jgi:hypothetical protein
MHLVFFGKSGVTSPYLGHVVLSGGGSSDAIVLDPKDR